MLVAEERHDIFGQLERFQMQSIGIEEELQNSQELPALSMHTNPSKNDDDAIDIDFGPTCPPGQEKNWIETLPDRGCFPVFRFYSPTEAYFEKSCKLPDIEKR